MKEINVRLKLNVNGDHAKIVNVLLKKMETVVLMMMNAMVYLIAKV